MTVQERRTEQVLTIAEDDLRARLIELEPQIKAEVDLMAQMIRELVKLEREKRGLDRPGGTLELWINKTKKHSAEPDWLGAGRVAGRQYRAWGWSSKTDKTKIALLPLIPK